MPTLITRKLDSTQKQDQPCNFSDPAQNELIEQHVTIEELRARCDRYKQLLASLQPPQDTTMIRAANFTTESVQNLIQQRPGSAFIRVYYGIDENGEHLLFMAPVSGSATLVVAEDTTYVDDCCHCPPMGNCPNDELLDV